MILIKMIMKVMIMIMRSKNLGTSLGRGKAPVSGKDQHEQSAGVSQGALLLHTDHDDDAGGDGDGGGDDDDDGDGGDGFLSNIDLMFGSSLKI